MSSDRLRDTLSGLRDWLRARDGMVAIGVPGVAVLVAVVAIAAVMPIGDDADLGRWSPLVDAEAAARAVLIDYDADSGALGLRADPNQIDTLLTDPREKKFLRTHLEKFNRVVRGRRFDAPGLVQGPSDTLFSVVLEPDEANGLRPRLRIKDLSAYNLVPAGARIRKQLGTVHMAPESSPRPFISDGRLGFFLDPERAGDLPLRVSLARNGIHGAGRITLTGEDDQPRAVLSAALDGSGVRIEPVGDQGIFLDNNPPLSGEPVIVRPGEIAEIGGRFFEVAITDGAGLATTRVRGDRADRIYPMGDLFHIVGPVSVDGSHQSLGIEYLFQEYLMGVPEQEIAPGELWLTLDRRLQASLSNGLDKLARDSRRGIASALIMDARSGAIVAMAGTNRYDPEDTRQIVEILQRGEETFYNHGTFKRHNIGSTTKAIFAFMALQVMGDRVEDLVVDVADDRLRTLFGHELYGRREAFMKVKYHMVGFDDYLIRSDNPFQHSLGMLLLAGVRDTTEIPPEWWDGRVLRPARPLDRWLEAGDLGKRRDWLRLDPANPFLTELARIFDIETTPGAGKLHDYDLSIYGTSFLSHAGIVLSARNPRIDQPERIFRARAALCAPEMPRMELTGVRNTKDASNLLYGANRNTWTDVKLCESFSRITTGKRVRARLVSRYRDTLTGELVDLGTGPEPEDLDVPNPSAFATMRRILARVPRRAGGGYPEGTAVLLDETVSRMARAHPGFGLVGKTGTIDDGDREELPDSRLFLGTFGQIDEAGVHGPAYTFTVYLKNAVDKDSVNRFIEGELPIWWRLLEARDNPDETTATPQSEEP